MKKVKLILISIVPIFVFCINAYATSCILKVSTDNVQVGDSFIVTANMSSAAAWNIHVSASGPVSDCTINQADTTADAMDTNKIFNATCKATGEGTITVSLSGDITSATDGNAVQISDSKNITVSKKVEPQPTEPTEPQKPTEPTTTNNDNKSKNNNLKNISIEGYDLVKVDNHNYTLSVPNNVTSINVKATAEDNKSKITGLGKHNINIGENNIEIVVTAENGNQNKINIKVTRKDDYYLEDLDSLLKNNEKDNINITIEPTTKISSTDLEKIKKSKKTVNLNVYNSNKNLLYSWIIDGSKITNTNDLLTTITNDSVNKKERLKLSNYADGVLLELKQKDNLPNNTKIKIFVGDKYGNNDVVNIYGYIKNNSELKLLKNNVKVDKGYIEFEVEDATDYFITMSTISNSDEVVTTPTTEETSSSNPKLKIIIGTLSLLVAILLILLIILFTKNNKRKKKNKKVNKEIGINNNDIPINTSNNTNTVASSQIQNNTSINNTVNNQKQVNNNSTTYEPWFK